MKYRLFITTVAMILLLSCKDMVQNENLSEISAAENQKIEPSENSNKNEIGNLPEDAVRSADGSCTIIPSPDGTKITIATHSFENEISFPDDPYIISDLSRVEFSKTNKYAALDFGTGSGARTIAFLNCHSGKLVFKDSYLSDLSFEWENETFQFHKVTGEEPTEGDERLFTYETYKFVDGKVEKTGITGKSSGE
ncbi:hypothetical protein [Leptospira sp. GIMC2001]|uniref:hypothetical protein n=1 Tax=Leptospira sp. GIMC2001 TaxID=1513297 RepID=UPI002349D7BA|nr:hypothetical protein [Leptospira sp. GIMC2001]WCL48042.1 hypothetical protein O4O04_12015 [Leptospira sp. GIMC2001]